MLTDLVEIAPTRKSRPICFHHYQRGAACASFFRGLSDHDNDIRILSVSNIGLRTIDDIVVPIPARDCLYPLKVRARSRFSHRNRGDRLTADHRG